jgi:hypothetical protein
MIGIANGIRESFNLVPIDLGQVRMEKGLAAWHVGEPCFEPWPRCLKLLDLMVERHRVRTIGDGVDKATDLALDPVQFLARGF